MENSNFDLTLVDATQLVRLARDAMKTYLIDGREIEPPAGLPESFLQTKGVFLTLETYPTHEIRGYIGFPYPENPLAYTIIRAAIGTAVGYMRFPEIKYEELEKIVIRITITSEPKKITAREPKSLVKQIVIGRDGLIAQAGRHVARLLPQVAVENGWNEEEFLSRLCIHAGLPSYAWQEGKVEISTFSAQIFEEEKPDGSVREVKLKTY